MSGAKGYPVSAAGDETSDPLAPANAKLAGEFPSRGLYV